MSALGAKERDGQDDVLEDEMVSCLAKLTYVLLQSDCENVSSAHSCNSDFLLQDINKYCALRAGLHENNLFGEDAGMKQECNNRSGFLESSRIVLTQDKVLEPSSFKMAKTSSKKLGPDTGSEAAARGMKWWQLLLTKKPNGKVPEVKVQPAPKTLQIFSLKRRTSLRCPSWNLKLKPSCAFSSPSCIYNTGLAPTQAESHNGIHHGYAASALWVKLGIGKSVLALQVNAGFFRLTRYNAREWPYFILGSVGSALLGLVMPFFALVRLSL